MSRPLQVQERLILLDSSSDEEEDFSHFLLSPNELFLKGAQVDIIYGWPVWKKEKNLHEKLRGKQLRKGDWVSHHQLGALWKGYDGQHHHVEVTLAENNVEIWKVLDVRLHQDATDDAAADR